MAAGKFIVLEGPEGSGKSTLAESLAARIALSGVEIVAVREPGGTPVAEAIRHELWHANREWSPEAELLLVAAARADLVSGVIEPAISAGKVVLSDRFDLSTKIYQGVGRGVDLELIEMVNSIATKGLVPDATIVLDLDASAGRERQAKAGMEPDRMEREQPEFHERIATAYAAVEGPGVHHVDGSTSPEQVANTVWKILVGVDPMIFRRRAGLGEV